MHGHCFFVGYNHYPDEKGTERLIQEDFGEFRSKVTTTTPMKRGLKERNQLKLDYAAYAVTTTTPMKRGLKDDAVTGNVDGSDKLQPLPQ